MKFTLSWLHDHLETTASLAEICDMLPMLGLEVEELNDSKAQLAPFIIAEILSAEPHPEADRLRVCQVNDGTQTIQIVCGAPNASAGLKTVLAPVGTYIPGLDITIKQGKIRGQISNGMMCSASELGLGDEHDGIMALADDAPVGTSFAGFAEETGLAGLDPVIDIAITPNRGDCLGVRGIARDLAAAGLGTLKTLDFSEQKGSFESKVTWQITPDAKQFVPLVSGRMFTDVNNGPSPDWMARRLTAVGQRPISALVDITNYIMIDLGRPLHAYDVDKIKGDKLVITAASDGDDILALNEKTYRTEPGMLVIGDEDGPDDIAGIMGGERSGVSDATTQMFLEIAVFDPVCVATTGRKLNLHSDARYRFERGLDQNSPVSMAGYIARMVMEICGGRCSHLVVEGTPYPKAKTMSFSPKRTEELTGVLVEPAIQAKILDTLGFEIADSNAETWEVTVPYWRNDIDGTADLVEEIIRIHGFDKLEMQALPRTSVVARPAFSAAQKRAPLLRRLLASRGLTEAVTFSFMKSEDAALFGGGSDKLRVANPISSDLDMMRPSILPNLLGAAQRNINRGLSDISLFEIGPIFDGPDEDAQPVAVSAIRIGARRHANWQHSAEEVDLYDIKSDLVAALKLIGVSTDNLLMSRDAPSWMHPGRSGRLRLGKMDLGIFGEVHPSICQHFDVKSRVMGFEFRLDAVQLPRNKGPMKPLLALSSYQSVTRDFAFIVDVDVDAQSLIQSIRKAARDVVQSVSVFDVYQGPGIAEGQKSIALTATLQPKDATFSEDELKAISDAIISTVEKNTGGVLRS